MSKIESAEHSFMYDPKHPDRGCIRSDWTDDIAPEILRQLNQAKTDSLVAQGLLAPAGELLGQIAKDGLRSPLKGEVLSQIAQDGLKGAIGAIDNCAEPAVSDDPPFVSDCGWGKPKTALERYAQADREHVAATVNKYFSKIDQGFCFGIGKDHELSKEELVDFLVSDDSKELTERETADLIKVLKKFDKIRNSESDEGCIMTMGITRGDLWAYAQGREPIYERILFDLKHGNSKNYDVPTEINKK